MICSELGYQIHTGIRLWAGQSRVLITASVRDFSFLQNLQTESDVHPGSYSIGNEALSPTVKQLGHEGNHPPLFSAQVKTD